MSELGVDKIKAALLVLIHIGMDVEDNLADDGKITWPEVGEMAMSNALDIFSVVKNAGELVAQLKDWDPVERAEVLAYVVEEFDLDNDKAEKVIEAGLTLVKDAGELYAILKG